MRSLNLQPKIIIFDTEFTAWEGSLARNWNGPGEYREIIQIGAILVDTQNLQELDFFAAAYFVLMARVVCSSAARLAITDSPFKLYAV